MSDAIPSTPAVPDTPFCGDLRSKRFMMLDTIPTEAAQYFDPSGHCWCYHTNKAIGPDGFYVDPEDCRPGRPCYRSALAPEIEPFAESDEPPAT